MFLFECSKCRKRTHHPSKRLAKCCDNATFEQLVNICLLIPKEAEPTFKVVTKSPEVSTALKLTPNQEWVTACNSSELPKMRTSFPGACTCYKCTKWLESNNKQAQAQAEANALEELLNGVDFIDEENPENSIRAKVKEISKEVKEAPKETMDEILAKIETLHDSLKKRKILRY